MDFEKEGSQNNTAVLFFECSEFPTSCRFQAVNTTNVINLNIQFETELKDPCEQSFSGKTVVVLLRS